MGNPPAKKKQRVYEDKDKISNLSDDVIHRILSLLDAKEAVQTSVLSKRWKFVWTTLPILNFGEYQHSSPENTYQFIRHVLSNRNHQSHISDLMLCTAQCKPSDSLVENFVEYAITHNVECLNLKFLYPHDSFKLSSLSSNLLKKLTLQVRLEEFASEAECWNLPALTQLRLVRPLVLFEDPDFTFSDFFSTLPGSCLTCLPALRTLILDNWDLLISSFSFSLPHLTTLHMSRCIHLPLKIKIWNFPALLSLKLDGIDFPENMSDIFTKLVNLQNLTLSLTRSSMEQHHSISCPQLLNLYIKIQHSDSLYGNIKVLAPKLRNFSCVGILSITLEVPELETVNIKSHYWSGNLDWIYRKKLYCLLTDMLSGLGNAKYLTFDWSSIEALSAANFLASLTSPFYKLKFVKLPPGYEESRMSGALRTYLLGGSPKATIVTTLSRNKVNFQAVPVSVASRKVISDEPYTTQSDVKIVDANRVRQIGSPVEGTSNDGASSSGNSGLGLWHGHEVNFEFVGLLDIIMKNHPGTFEHSTAKSERFYTMMLNMLCASVNEFLRTSMAEFNTAIITEYRDLFADLQRWGFNVVWLVNHLNYIEQLLVSQHELHATDSCMDNAKNILQELQTYCLEKITEIHKGSG